MMNVVKRFNVLEYFVLMVLYAKILIVCLIYLFVQLISNM